MFLAACSTYPKYEKKNEIVLCHYFCLVTLEKANSQVQLGCPLVRHWAYANIDPRLVLDFSLKTNKGMFSGFFVRPQDELVWPVFAS